jgi:hypothetical protein
MEARRVAAVDRQSNELLNWLNPEPELSGMTEIACGSNEFDPLFPFPPRGKPGREGVPPRRKHAARQQKALARIDAAGSPLKRAAAPLWIPCERCSAELGPVRTNRMFGRRRPKIGRCWRIVYTETLTLLLKSCKKTKKIRHGVLT